MVRRIAVATVTVGVSIVAGCGLFLGEPEIGSGSLSITSWAEDFAQEGIDGLDPNESVNSVLIVEPEIDGKTVFLTGEGGALDIDNVPVGDYTVRPLHAGSDYARSVTVAGGETVEIEVPTPSAGIYFYFFNHDSTDPPFNSTDVRQAFNIAIDRDSIVDYLADDPDLDFDTAPTAAYSYIPTSLQESDWEVATIPDDDTVGANELLESQGSPFSFEVLYNLVDDQEIPHGSIAEVSLADIEALNKVNSYTTKAVDFSNLISSYSDGTFELARFGWLLPSNNLYEYFSAITDDYWIKASYHNTELDILLSEMKNALDDGDLDTYDEKILAVNQLLIDDAAALPVYEY